MSEGFTYYAFISYSHKDVKWAKWLQRKLESYHLPTAIAKDAGRSLPKRISPVFLDTSDLNAGKLDDNLHRALEESRYLIVLCSPNSAKPNSSGRHFVNDEVEYFCSLGKEESVIPVIIDGVPGDPERECYCPKIKELELTGPDANKLPREMILNNVIAKILGLRPNELWQRERRRRIRHRIFAALGMLLLLAGVLAGGAIAYDRHRVHVEYYADCGDVFGMPQGISRLTKAQMKVRSSHYRFVYRGRRRLFGERVLREVIHSNSAGRPTAYDERLKAENRPVWCKIGYDSELKLQYIDVFEKNGVLRERREFGGKGATVVDFKTKDRDDVLVGAFRSAAPGSDTKANIRRWRVRRDKQGRPHKIRFFRDDVAVTPSCNAEGYFGLEFEYDRLGRVTKRCYLDQNGERMTLKNGTVATVYEYDANGLTAFGRVDGKGEFIDRTTFRYDAQGNVEAIANYIGGRLAIRDGFAEMRCKYDGRGNRIEKAYFGTDGKPCLHKNGYAKQTYKYDERGNLIEVVCFDVDGKPCMHKNGYAKWTRKYDERGNIIEEAYFGIDGKPCLHKNGYAKLTMKYDERGNRIEVVCFDVDGKLCMHKNGYAKWTRKYDERGNCIEYAYFGVDGKPCLHKNGCARQTGKYDERGNLIEVVCFDVDGKLCMHKNGCAKWTRKYDERGKCIEWAYFGADGKPCLIKAGYAKLTKKYDERGKCIEWAYFGADGKPCLIKAGYAKLTKKYDERGNCTEQAYFGTDGKPCLHKNGYAKATGKYDERRNRIETAYFGIDGKPCRFAGGFAKIRIEYDERRNVKSVVRYDVDGKPMK